MQERQRFGRSLHRASYVLERGIWRATCQHCGYQVSDGFRRQAASQFRLHIQEHRGEPLDGGEIDLREAVPSGPRPFTPRPPAHQPPDTRARQTGPR